jgi:hypothetical protein
LSLDQPRRKRIAAISPAAWGGTGAEGDRLGDIRRREGLEAPWTESTPVHGTALSPGVVVRTIALLT